MQTCFAGCIDEENEICPISGSGKTGSMTGIGFLDYGKGITVWSNYDTTFSEEVIGFKEMIDRLSSGQVENNLHLLITEMQDILDALGSDTHQVLFIDYFFRQVRKVGEKNFNVDVSYDAQRFNSIHKRLRIHTQRIFIPYKYHYNNKMCFNPKCMQPHKIKVYPWKPFSDRCSITFDMAKLAELYDPFKVVHDKVLLTKEDIRRMKEGDFIK